MIFLLDFILLINFFIAYKYFKYIYAPPILLGGGMLLASLIATSYYPEWELNTFMFESAMVLGIGPLLFTFFCFLCSRKKVAKKHPANIKISIKNKSTLIVFLIFSILLGFIGCILRIKSYAAYFGAYSIPELLFAFRLDTVRESTFQLPHHISIISTYTIILSYFTSYGLWIMVIFKEKGNILRFLFIVQIAVTVFNGVLMAAKGAIMDILVRSAIIYICILYIYNKADTLPRSFYKLTIVVSIIFFISFKSLGLLIGRDLDERSNSDVIAEYCGAEIKNFDIYMHGKDGNKKISIWGEETFRSIYDELGIKEIQRRDFQYIHGCSLGNVYTQYFSMHKDFGWIGIIIISFLMSSVSMYIYNKTLKYNNLEDLCRRWLIIYASIGFTIFMGFFSFRFSEYVFTINFIRNLIYIYLLDWILKRFHILNISIKSSN